MTYRNVTGTLMVPACPDHPEIAFIPEERYTYGGKLMTGFWRCPVDNKVYQNMPDV